jgi:Ni,Fe-hydrogenase III component G
MNDIAKIDPADLVRLTELQSQISSIREQLKPRYEAIQKEVQDMKLQDDVLFLMNFEDKTTFKTSVEWNDQKINVTFAIAKVQ